MNGDKLTIRQEKQLNRAIKQLANNDNINPNMNKNTKAEQSDKNIYSNPKLGHIRPFAATDARKVGRVIKQGDKVTVHNSTQSGKPIIEGTATIISVENSDSIGAFCQVRFYGERETHLRYIKHSSIKA